ncbi:arylamine N-acetyltransferase [Curtobacterium sp. L1-20]|uniref:arylamine N-acetyltransferase n=1 Tax=Curtobacterium sp. L1-20 TaxID=3138181 RepID=UPI003B51AD2E
MTNTIDGAETIMTMTPNGAAPISEYLARIEQDSAPRPTAGALRVLQRAHLMHVPFDTIDTYLTRHEDLDPRAVTERIVNQRRGGTKSQLNVGFAVLLHGLGYMVDLVLAQSSSPRLRRAESHLALIVATAGSRFLVDVSGELSDEPLAIGASATQLDTAGTFALSTTMGPLLEVSAPGDRHYTISAVTPASSGRGPRSIAGRDRPKGLHAATVLPALSIRRERGRTTLMEGRLIETVGTARTDITVAPASLRQIVEERFGFVPTTSRLAALAGPKR